MRPRRLTSMWLLAVALAACGGGGLKTAAPSPSPSPTETGPEDDGDFLLTYGDPLSEEDAAVAQFLQGSGTIEETIDSINVDIALPTDVQVVIGPGEPSPFYDPSAKRLEVQYSFVVLVDEIFTQANPELSDEEILEKDLHVTRFVLMHELGHALIDLLDIPVLGREEDAVDALATVVMTEIVEGGEVIAFQGADFFATLAQLRDEFEESDFWDEHSLDLQRAYAIVCWIAGSSEESYNEVAEAEIFDTDRLESCPAEYQQKVKSWFQVLEPHVKG